MFTDKGLGIQLNKGKERNLSGIGDRFFEVGSVSELPSFLRAKPVDLKDQVGASEQIDEDWLMIVDLKNRNGYFREVAYSEESIKYLDDQISQFLKRNPNKLKGLQSGDLNSVLSFVYQVVKAGTSGHREGFNVSEICEAFDIDDPKPTKCNKFNELFRLIIERTIENYRPDMKGKYAVISTSSTTSFDLPKSKIKNIGLPTNKSKRVPHAFITIMSKDIDGNLVFSSMDPYHMDFGVDDISRFDFTKERSMDSLYDLINLSLFGYSENGGLTLSKEGRRLFYIDLAKRIDDLTSLGDRCELATFLCNVWPWVFDNYLVAEGDYKSARNNLTEKISRYEDAPNQPYGKPWVDQMRKVATDFYNRADNDTSYQKQRFRKEFAERIKNMYSGIVGGVIGEILGKVEFSKIEPEDMIYLVDLVDSAGYFGVDIDSEVWRRLNTFLENQNVEDWRLALRDTGDRRSFNCRLRRHFENSWGHEPVEVSLTTDDLREIDSESNYFQYVKWRIGILKLIENAGISSWKKFLPDKPQPQGSYAEYLVESLK